MHRHLAGGARHRTGETGVSRARDRRAGHALAWLLIALLALSPLRYAETERADSPARRWITLTRVSVSALDGQP